MIEEKVVAELRIEDRKNNLNAFLLQLLMSIVLLACIEPTGTDDKTNADSIHEDLIKPTLVQTTVSTQESEPALDLDSVLTDHYDKELISTFKVGENTKAYILYALECMECDANRNLHIVLKNDSTSKILSQYPIPGKVYFYENDELIYEARAFYGEILPDTFGMIWYQSGLQDEGQWQSSVYLLEINGLEADGREVEAKIEQSLDMVAQKKAFELEGESRTSAP